jgi:hypothetical protein
MTYRLGAGALLLGALLVSREGAAQSAVVGARKAFQEDVHAVAGLTCEACHMQSARRPGTYDAPRRVDIAPLCARCHSDAAYMRQFDPQVRIDQFAQYLTSVHGKKMVAGETRVATCSDCPTAHGVRRAGDARSPVAPLNVATTCARCHADAARMTPCGRDAAPFRDGSFSGHGRVFLVDRSFYCFGACSSSVCITSTNAGAMQGGVQISMECQAPGDSPPFLPPH